MRASGSILESEASLMEDSRALSHSRREYLLLLASSIESLSQLGIWKLGVTKVFMISMDYISY